MNAKKLYIEDSSEKNAEIYSKILCHLCFLSDNTNLLAQFFNELIELNRQYEKNKNVNSMLFCVLGTINQRNRDLIDEHFDFIYRLISSFDFGITKDDAHLALLSYLFILDNFFQMKIKISRLVFFSKIYYKKYKDIDIYGEYFAKEFIYSVFLMADLKSNFLDDSDLDLIDEAYNQCKDEIRFKQYYLNFLFRLFLITKDDSEKERIIEKIDNIISNNSEIIIDLDFISEDDIKNEDNVIILIQYLAKKRYLKNTKYNILGSFIVQTEFDLQTRKDIITLFSIINEIKYQLVVKSREKDNLHICHYTSREVLEKYLSEENLCKTKDGWRLNTKSRLNNVSYMNDPLEGKVLIDYLTNNFNNVFTPSEEDILCSNQLISKPWFLMCLTNKVDDLAMWSQYGASGEGVCVILDKEDFIFPRNKIEMPHISIGMRNVERNKDELLENDEKNNNINTHDYLYRVCYLGLENDKIVAHLSDLFLEDEIVKINQLLNKLGLVIESLKNNSKKFNLKGIVTLFLREIQFLFKSNRFIYESEIRLIRYERIKPANPNIKIDYPHKSGLGKLFVERNSTLKVKKIIFGPKFKEIENYIPLTYLAWPDIVLDISEIGFR